MHVLLWTLLARPATLGMSYLRRPNFLLLRTSFDEDYAPNPVNTELYTTLAKKDAVRKAKTVFEVRRGWVIIT